MLSSDLHSLPLLAELATLIPKSVSLPLNDLRTTTVWCTSATVLLSVDLSDPPIEMTTTTALRPLPARAPAAAAAADVTPASPPAPPLPTPATYPAIPNALVHWFELQMDDTEVRCRLDAKIVVRPKSRAEWKRTQM